MKNTLFGLIMLSIVSLCYSQGNDTIKLLAPHKQGGKPLMQAINERHSSRNFDTKDLTDQQLSDILWVSYGINRTSEDKRTIATANNKQEMDVYIATSKGVFRYDAEKNCLINILKEDIRSKTGSQGYVKDAAANLLYVINKDKSGAKDETGKLVCGAIAAGAMSQDVYLYCASENLGSVVRGSYDKNSLSQLLKLSGEQEIILAQSVGYIK